MSDGRFCGFDALHEALEDEDFRRRLTEADKQAERLTSWNRSMKISRPTWPSWPLRIRTDGENMTIADTQRQTVRLAIQKSAFEDPVMREFGEANSFELGEVLARARKLGGGDPRLHDTSVAQDIIVLIRGFKLE